MAYDITVLVGIVITILIYSFLYKDQFLFRFAETSLLATGIGVAFVTAFNSIINIAVRPIMTQGRWDLIIIVILGLLFFTPIISGKASWSLGSQAVLMGISIAVFLQGNVTANIWGNIAGTIPTNLAGLLTFDTIVTVVTVAACIMYFFYSRPVKGVYGGINRAARYLFMVQFGVNWGTFVTYRINLLVGRLIFIMRGLGIIA